MKKSKKVLMTSDKTWIRKEEWDFQKKHTEELQEEWIKRFFLNDKGVSIKELKRKLIGITCVDNR